MTPRQEIALTTTTTATPRALDIGGLETVYDALAAAIDRAGPEKSELFLVKLAVLNANAMGDAQRFQQHLDAALRDL
jgi:hypothetical protein